MTLSLEVLDHRRPIAHLDAMADPSVVSAVRTLVGGWIHARSCVRHRGTDPSRRCDGQQWCCGLCAAFGRGRRHFALAAPIARTRADRWCMTALRVL
ncbi:Rv3235 family protein [Nocardia sp. NPDC051756]|uniref:Rv3235 family protein n=1 Tax=Nocardia sp. NPDC051756 TaxID=3154751 RepID=UPI00342B88EF